VVGLEELAAVTERALAVTEGAAIATARRSRTARAILRGGAPAGGGEDDRVDVEVVAFHAGHVGGAVTSDLGATSLRDAAQCARAVALAAARAAGPGPHPGPAPPAMARAHDGFDPAAGSVSAATLLGALAAVGDDGELAVRARWTALAASTGLRAADATSEARARLRAPGAGTAAGAAVGLGALALERLALLAGRRGVAADGHAPAPGGEVAAVLAPEALAELLRALAAVAFNGLRHAAAEGALCGRLGTRVATPAVNLSDSPRFGGTLPAAFDAEGVPKSPLPLIQDGVAHRVVHDRRSAAVAGGGADSTGHALAAGGAPGGPEPRNLVLVGGGTASEEELTAVVGEGVYAAGLAGLHVLDASRAEVLAVLDGARRIERGTLGAPVGPLLLRDSALEALGRVEALTARPRLVGTGARAIVCPAARIRFLRLEAM
jgi:predicted Zn-dependent protease